MTTTKPQVRTYTLPPTPLIPNSPHVLIHYPGLLGPLVRSPTFSTTQIFDLFASNDWQTQWIARYGPDQKSHYHSTTHECMVVISGGSARILFGRADADAAEDAQGKECGILLDAELGDVFVLPAGVAHKTHDPCPLTEGLAFHERPDGVDEQASREFLAKVPLEGEFMMMGAYPSGGKWDFAVGGEHRGRFGEVWDVEVPERDPVLGASEVGLRGLWGKV